jgi:uncharacterized protein (DUF2141 family)
MSKVRIGKATMALCAMLAWPFAGQTVIAGPYAAACTSGEPAMLVRVTGFKARTGVIRVQSYGGDPDHYFDKGTYLKRIELPVPTAGPLEVCVPVPGPGQYAISVRHDIDGSGKTSHADGGGMSGNPHVSLFDLMFKRKPAADKVAIAVSHGVRVVPVILNYVSGTSFQPVAAES